MTALRTAAEAALGALDLSELEKIRERAKGATPNKWVAMDLCRADVPTYNGKNISGVWSERPDQQPDYMANLLFLNRAYEDIPFLLAHIDAIASSLRAALNAPQPIGREELLETQLMLAAGFIIGVSTIVPDDRREDVREFGERCRLVASPPHRDASEESA